MRSNIFRALGNLLDSIVDLTEVPSPSFPEHMFEPFLPEDPEFCQMRIILRELRNCSFDHYRLDYLRMLHRGVLCSELSDMLATFNYGSNAEAAARYLAGKGLILDPVRAYTLRFPDRFFDTYKSNIRRAVERSI